MKKAFYSFLAVTALAACSKPAEQEVKPNQGNGFRITVNTAETKPEFNSNDLSVSFKTNEVLHVKINEGYYDFQRIEDSNEFYCDKFFPVENEAYHYEILTPYRSDYGEGEFSLSGGANCTMFGMADATGFESPSIEMNHLAALIRLRIHNTGTTELQTKTYRIESDTDIIGGRHHVEGGIVTESTKAAPVKYTTLTSGNNLTIGSDETKEMYLQCKPFTTTVGSKITVTIACDNDVFIRNISFNSAVSFEAGKVNTILMEIGDDNVASVTSANKVLVDFGGNYIANPDTEWNTYNKRGTAETDYVNLIKADGTASGLTMRTTKAFEGSGYSFTYSNPWTLHGVEYPAKAVSDALYAKSTAGQLTISGCTPGAEYRIETIHLRQNSNLGMRILDVEVNGSKLEKFDCLNPSGEQAGQYQHHLVFHNVAADADGKIVITYTPQTGANGTTKEGMINAMIITKY